MKYNASPDVRGFGKFDQDEYKDVAKQTDVFDVLSNERRVWIIQWLDIQDGETTYRELVTAVAEQEYDRPDEEISGKEKNRIRVSCIQSHLPALKKANIIEHDRQTDTIWFGEQADEALSYARKQTSLMARIRARLPF